MNPTPHPEGHKFKRTGMPSSLTLLAMTFFLCVPTCASALLLDLICVLDDVMDGGVDGDSETRIGQACFADGVLRAGRELHL